MMSPMRTRVHNAITPSRAPLKRKGAGARKRRADESDESDVELDDRDDDNDDNKRVCKRARSTSASSSSSSSSSSATSKMSLLTRSVLHEMQSNQQQLLRDHTRLLGMFESLLEIVVSNKSVRAKLLATSVRVRVRVSVSLVLQLSARVRVGEQVCSAVIVLVRVSRSPCALRGHPSLPRKCENPGGKSTKNERKLRETPIEISICQTLWTMMNNSTIALAAAVTLAPPAPSSTQGQSQTARANCSRCHRHMQ
jgi:hypothetical protein